LFNRLRSCLTAAGAGLLGAALLGSPAAAQQQPIGALAFALDGRYNSIHSWTAGFEQVFTSGLSSERQRGRLYLAKPGRMRWDYQQPERKTFLVSGGKVWQDTAGAREATVEALPSSHDLRTPLRFLLGHLDLPKELKGLSYSGLRPWHKGDVVIQGSPTERGAGWRQVFVEVAPGYEIARLVIVGVDGSQNDIRFSEIRTNLTLPKNVFRFTPPAGVRVVPGGE
jgi:outer membrane lipoprotein carrier protein